MYRTLKDVVSELGMSKKRVQRLFDKYLEFKGVPKDVFKFRASWGGWMIAMPDEVYNEFVDFIRRYEEGGVGKSPPAGGVGEHVRRLRNRMIADGLDEEVVDRVVDTVVFLDRKGLYGKSVASVARELERMGLSPSDVRRLVSNYRVALIHEY